MLGFTTTRLTAAVAQSTLPLVYTSMALPATARALAIPEIVSHIASFVEPSFDVYLSLRKAQILCRLALVNKLFYKAVIPVQYRVLDLFYWDYDDGNVSLLIRTLKAHPEFAQYTREISVQEILPKLLDELSGICVHVTRLDWDPVGPRRTQRPPKYTPPK